MRDMAITKTPADSTADVAAPAESAAEPAPARRIFRELQPVPAPYDAAADIRAHRTVLTELVNRTNFGGDLGVRDQCLELLGAPSTSQD